LLSLLDEKGREKSGFWVDEQEKKRGGDPLVTCSRGRPAARGKKEKKKGDVWAMLMKKNNRKEVIRRVI